MIWPTVMVLSCSQATPPVPVRRGTEHDLGDYGRTVHDLELEAVLAEKIEKDFRDLLTPLLTSKKPYPHKARSLNNATIGK